MKRTLCLILCLAFVIALFAGCGGDDADVKAPENKGESSNVVSTPDGNTAAETGANEDEDEDSPYHFAKGKFSLNAAGYSDVKYDYPLPLSTTDEVITYWTTCYTPQYIAEDGLGSMPYPKGKEELTGVHVDYIVVSSDSRAENFSVLLAADDLSDIMCQAMYFYTGTARSAIDDDWFINLYDYREYMPNYLYELWSRDDIDVLKYGRIDDVTWPAIYGMLVEPAPGSGYMLRQDWMDKYGLGDASDVDTFDEMHDVLTGFKSNGVEWPMEIFNCIETTAGYSFSGYNTSCYLGGQALPYAKVIDGKVQFTLTTEDDRDLVTMLNKWYSEGLIDPNYASFGSTQDMANEITTGKTGAVVFTPSEVEGWEAATTEPGARWAPAPRLKKTEDQVLKYGQKLSNFHLGSASVSATCENIPLACTWLDWVWSEEGCLYDNWGVEGLTWEYDENGNRMLTDFVLHNPDGLGAAWVMVLYGCNGLLDPCLQIHKRNYAYPGGERFLAMMDIWSIPDYNGEYDFPTGISYTDDQQERINEYSNDLVTYISENYLGFIDGSKPMTEWDSYVAGCEDFGMSDILDVYQEAYEAYIA